MRHVRMMPVGSRSGDRNREGVTIEEVGPAILEQHDAGTMHPEWIRGYYGLVGGGAGFLILEVDDPNALNAMLAPSMRYMTWDIRAIVAYDYHEDIEEFRQAFGQTGDSSGPKVG